VAELDNFKAPLHDVVAVDVLNEVQTVGLQQFYHLTLQIFPLPCEFNCLLNHSTPVAVLRKFQNVLLYDVKQFLLVICLPPFENLLKNVVSELVFC
jgi:hypothetical protein